MVVQDVQDVPVRRGPRGPYAKSEQTRTAILDAALEVFAEAGYRSGSLRNVADRVGISEAGLLHHFRSKSALLAAVLERRDEQDENLFKFATDDGRTNLASLLALAEYNATVPGVVELFCTLSAEATSPDHPAHQYFVDRYARTVEMIRQAFALLDGQGELRAGVDPLRGAQQVIALWDGLQIQWLLDRRSLDMAEHLRDLLNSKLVTPL
jgi:AcrR family transcriptional regulator